MSGVYSAFGGTRWAYMVGSKVRGYYLTRAAAEAAERAEMGAPPPRPEWLTQPTDYPFCDTTKCPHWRGYCARDPACND